MALLLVAAGCATDNLPVHEYLDPQTGVTVRAMATPFIYARDINEFADSGHDYVSVGAVEVNRMGARGYYLAVVSWSRGAHDAPPAAASGAERLELPLGERALLLRSDTHDPRQLGVGAPPFRPVYGSYLGESWYTVTADELRAFDAAAPPVIKVSDAAQTRTYVVFERANAALHEFIGDIPAPASGEPSR